MERAPDDDHDDPAGGEGGDDPDDLLAEARRTRRDVMRGLGGRNALARLAAANQILDAKNYADLTDEQLRAEGNRIADEMDRRKALKAAK